jgi:hypothetical protein
LRALRTVGPPSSLYEDIERTLVRYHVRRKSTEIFANWKEELSEIRCLHEAQEVLNELRGFPEDKTDTEKSGHGSMTFHLLMEQGFER